ncbi:beta-propeller fold lactonase family protein [bacterium endosymbiont of Pedicinus badii]|uniref:beta-propeller fold lactonase family protein n=1 Tax=bacterium endosymbiont of Pedicinus badii TaxID=1719126 RepID=UPI0009BC4FA3|nr:beta-propeller fold lactonase family protein [bacterium endosymbiont of Pedicinus badii]OQM34331.1 hypothetical protein AOQ89_00330 [bacterium endosymbiont of Pedicinus badii]
MKNTDFFICVACLDEGFLYIFKFDGKKIVTLLKREKLKFCQPISNILKKKYFFVGTRKKEIFFYKKDPKKVIKKISFINIGCIPTYISVSEKKNLVFYASYHGNCFGIISIKKKKLFFVRKMHLSSCHCIIFDEKKKLIWATSLKEDSVKIYKLHKNLSISLHKVVKTSKFFGPRHIIFHPKNKYSYLIGEKNGLVSIIDRNSYKIIDNIASLPKNFNYFWSSEICITSNAKWIYTAERRHSILSCFIANQKGDCIKLLRIQKTTKQPRSFSIEKNGKYLACVGQESNELCIYKIDKKYGKLLNLCQIETGKNPISSIFL